MTINTLKWLCLGISLILLPLSGQAQESHPLSMREALSIALGKEDPSMARHQRRAEALGEQAIADGALPDPEISVDMANWPVENFSYTQEPMTQFKVGLQQKFSRGNSRALAREMRQTDARAEGEKYLLQKRKITLEVREAWLSLYYWQDARNQVIRNRAEVSDLLQVTEAIFVTGRQTSQDLLRAELELSILEDRLIDVEREIHMARATLTRLIGIEAARRPLSKDLPDLALPAELSLLQAGLTRHPSVRVNDAIIEKATKGIRLAEQAYKPGWTVRASYGLRGNERADFASLGVSMDIPLFTGNRQDRRLSAAKKNRQMARLDRDVKLLELNRHLARTHASWQGLDRRITLYDSVVIHRANDASSAALDAYRAGVSDFADLVRSRLTVLDAELTLTRLRVEKLKAHAQLLYLQGDE